jgi:murein DD-endopeptidase MepM/ murein hydrolase activator NlpD
VTATANSGYSFVNWTEGGRVVSTSASYSFTLTTNRTLVANFTTVSGQKAVLTTPAPGTTLAGASVTFGWTAGSGVSQYYLYLGTTVGAYDLYGQSQGTNLSVTVNGLPTDGRTLYVRLWSMLASGWDFNDYTYTAAAGSAAMWPIDGVVTSACYHVPGSGAHRPSGEVGNADDTYALDLNCKSNSDAGKAVHPVRNGTVRAYDAGDETRSSYVLVEHPESVIIDGVSYSSFFTAYVHMSGLTTSVYNDAFVTTLTTLGYVNHIGLPSGDHLHFVAYVGTWLSSARTNWGRLVSFDPSNLGGDFSGYSYSSYVWRRWVDNSASSGSYQFVANGTAADLLSDSSYGMLGSMRYTTTKASAPDDNSFEFKWNVPAPATHGYYVWPFIPSHNGSSTRATYHILSGTSTTTSAQAEATSYVVNQDALIDDYAKKPKVTIISGNYVALKVGDYTGESNLKLAADYAVYWWKADHCLGGCANSSEGNYCYQTAYESTTGSTGCTSASSLPAGF